MPLFSVIVPVYNVFKYLDQCIQSILSQTEPDFELLLVDDGSTDGSSDLCDTWALQDSRISVTHQANGGLSAARNKGLSKCNGNYIVFVDSDDFISIDLLQKVKYCHETSNADMVIFNFCYCSENGLPITAQSSTWNKTGVKTNVEVLNWFADDYIQLSCAWSKSYRRYLWDDILFPIGRTHEDDLTSHIIIDKCHCIEILPDKLYNYRYNQNSIMNTPSPFKNADALTAYHDRYFLLDQKCLKSAAKHQLTNFFKSYIYLYPQLIFSDNDSKNKYTAINSLFVNLYPSILKEHIANSNKQKIVLFLARYIPRFYARLYMLFFNHFQ